MTNQQLQERIYDAFVFGLPSYELARTRHNDLIGTWDQPSLPANTVQHGRSLSGAADRWITTPNNDTLYSRAWLDLSKGPVMVAVDAQPRGRYWSVALMDARTRNFAFLGERLHGEGPARITLVGPQDDISGMRGHEVRAPSNDVWLLARWIVEGDDDLAEARAMQDRLSILAEAAATPSEVVPTGARDPENFLAVVAEQLARNPLKGQEAAWMTSLAFVGVLPGERNPWSLLTAEVRDAWTANIDLCHQRLSQAFMGRRRQVDGWWVSEDQLGEGALGYEWRAGVALAGLGGLDSSEAVYAARATDDAGQPLHGQHTYRLIVPSSGIPADSFWSISLYELMPDGRRFFAHNPIGRYAISDRTPGLNRGPDNALEIGLQHTVPADALGRANWLPLPATPFVLVLRAYHPSGELRRWEVALPKLERVS